MRVREVIKGTVLAATPSLRYQRQRGRSGRIPAVPVFEQFEDLGRMEFEVGGNLTVTPGTGTSKAPSLLEASLFPIKLITNQF